MATDSDGEDEVKLLPWKKKLAVDEQLMEIARNATWSVSSCTFCNGIRSLRDDDLDTYWISDAAKPHLVNIQFHKKSRLQMVAICVNFKLDAIYTPRKISIRAGDGYKNLKGIKTVELPQHTGWVLISLSGSDPREAFVHTFMLQLANLANRSYGADCQIHQIKVFGPRPYPVPYQRFHFTSREFILMSEVMCSGYLSSSICNISDRLRAVY